MASWTDAPVEFNPYVQQQPVEALVSVGTELQRRYDEGVQRIQSSVDRIAGLDIARDVDKQYLQGKLDELGDKLKFVAAGDFSDRQLVNSVTGMTSKVGKDGNIQNAVISTARYRGEVERMNEAIEKGESAVQNEWDFGLSASEWLNNPNVGASFNGRFTPYTDVKESWFETLKQLHPNFREEDIAYNQIVKADGTIDYEVAAAMTRNSKEVLSAAQIENAIRANLSPQEVNQLSIDGRYRYRNVDPEILVEHTTRKNNAVVQANNQKIEELQGLIGLSSSNPKMIVEAERVIKELQQKNQTIRRNLTDEIQSIYDNPEQAKANIYKEEAIGQFAEGFAWEKNSTNILTNPVIQQQNWMKDHAIRVAQLRLSQEQFAWDKSMDMQGLQLKMQELNTSLYGDASITTDVPLDTDIMKGEPSPVLSLVNGIADANEDIDKDITYIARKSGASETQVRNAVDRYLNDEKEWNKDGIIPIQYEGIVEGIRKRNRELKTKQHIYDQEVGNQSLQYNTVRENVLQKIKDKDIKPVSIGGVTFTSEELVEYLIKDELGLPSTEKEKILDVGETTSLPRGSSMQMSYAPPLDRLKYIKRAIKDELSSYSENVNRNIAEKYPYFIPRVTNITFADDKGGIARKKWEDYGLHALIPFNEKVTGMQGGSAEISKKEIAKARQWLTGTDTKGKVHYKKMSYADNRYLLLEKGDETIKIPLSPQLAAQMPLRDPNEMSEEYRMAFETQFAFDGSTNPTGKYADAYFGRSDMPNIENLDMRADFNWDESNNVQQYVTLRLNVPSIGVVPLQLKKSMPREAAMEQFLRQLTDEQVKQLYLYDNRISEDWKEAIKNYLNK